MKPTILFVNKNPLANEGICQAYDDCTYQKSLFSKDGRLLVCHGLDGFIDYWRAFIGNRLLLKDAGRFMVHWWFSG